MRSMIKNSNALLDVWKWKEEIYEEFKSLTVDDMILAISKKAKEKAEEITKTKNPTTSSS